VDAPDFFNACEFPGSFFGFASSAGSPTHLLAAFGWMLPLRRFAFLAGTGSDRQFRIPAFVREPVVFYGNALSKGCRKTAGLSNAFKSMQPP
jgi:hypothetical protein